MIFSIPGCKWPDWLKLLSQSEQLYGLTPVWTLMWTYRLEDCLNELSHMWHLNGLSPLWILRCLTRPCDAVNPLPQTLHKNGFSAKWLRLCSARLWPLTQHRPHSVHLYLSLWTLICRLRAPLDVKRLSHWVHEYHFSPGSSDSPNAMSVKWQLRVFCVCLLMCLFNTRDSLNALPQM